MRAQDLNVTDTSLTCDCRGERSRWWWHHSRDIKPLAKNLGWRPDAKLLLLPLCCPVASRTSRSSSSGQFQNICRVSFPTLPRWALQDSGVARASGAGQLLRPSGVETHSRPQMANVPARGRRVLPHGRTDGLSPAGAIPVGFSHCVCTDGKCMFSSLRTGW